MTIGQGKHFMNDPSTLVSDSIQGFCYANPHVKWLPEHKVVYASNVNQVANQQVTLIAGGGSGHEPAHAGSVGDGMLTAAVCGHVFASPSASQVLAALERVQSSFGTLVIVKNYTGDCLNFGLAVERAKARGIKVVMLMVGDDTAVGRTKGTKVGRRGMAMVTLVIKCCGALAKRGASLEQVAEMGQYVIDHSATLGVALNHCHVPGSSSDPSMLGPLEMELGMGIHNEPGWAKLPLMAAQPLVKHVLETLVDQNDQDRCYLDLSDASTQNKTDVVLLVNNLGGTPSLEFNVIVKEAVETVVTHMPHLRLKRILSGSFVTSLNMPGFSLSLLKLTNPKADLVLDLLDSPVYVAGWPLAVSRSTFTLIAPTEDDDDEKTHSKTTTANVNDDEQVNQFLFTKVLCKVIQALVDTEPTITSYDTLLGDGDCGKTMVYASEAIEKQRRHYPLTSTSQTLLALADIVDRSVGGTSSAIYCIFLNALANGLNIHGGDTSLDTWAKACTYALDSLQTYTKARVGDRTLMDALIPFVTSLEKGASLHDAVVQARLGMDATIKQVAQLGRTSYLSDQDVQKAGVPDAGAFGLVTVLEAISAAVAEDAHD
ncbi:unnamed protein product [Absidia cylindrospora]